ncbi:LrgB-like family-domain-containing protein [Poronia punctata]|nr:LrgB-like family-domain-containing protein [Poronia punctata]
MSNNLGAIQLITNKNLIIQWLSIPFGIIIILSICFGIDKLLQLGDIVFPASVACLVILFLALLGLEYVIGEYRTRRFVAVVEIPGGWSLRWINVFFTPSFVLLPLSPAIGGVEVLKIMAVFVIGFIAMMAFAAYMTRGLQLALGTSKRALTERAEELGRENDEIPMTAVSNRRPSFDSSVVVSEVQPPSRALDTLPGRRREEEDDDEESDGDRDENLPAQTPLPPSRASKWALIISSRLDLIIYTILFLFVGIPIYCTLDYAMPLHLTFTILSYFTAMSLPPNWRQYLHPVLVSSLMTVLGIWVFGLLIKGHNLPTVLQEFRTGATYLHLHLHPGSRLPGAADIFSSILDASIVSLALPMYRYRRELRQHFLAIVLPNVILSIGSLFAYPYICFAIGISAERSLAFTARSLTLALAIPAVSNLGGDLNTVAALAITSGILGVLIGRKMLALLKIPEDDYVTRGVTLGANSSAIATALLLRTDPRAAALSSLSMGLFGAVTVLFTSIPPIAHLIRSIVGL